MIWWVKGDIDGCVRDSACVDSQNGVPLVQRAFAVGFNRVGIVFKPVEHHLSEAGLRDVIIFTPFIGGCLVSLYFLGGNNLPSAKFFKEDSSSFRISRDAAVLVYSRILVSAFGSEPGTPLPIDTVFKHHLTR